MSDLADAVLPLIRTRADLLRWSASNEHGRQMHDAVDILERAFTAEDAMVVFKVTQKAIASGLTVILRADDSSGVIGDAVGRLLELHPKAAAKARPPVGKLVDWMEKFQFDNEADYFNLDVVAYAPALGEAGVSAYRARLDAVAARIRPEPADRWSSPHSHEWHVLEWNAQRLAVLDRDVDAIIRTHARDRKVAAWFQDTAEALAEIGEMDLAVDWARQGLHHEPWHQALKAGEYWCSLLEENRPGEVLEARLEVFRRWPNASTAHHLHAAAGTSWEGLRDEVLEGLSRSAFDAVTFTRVSLRDVGLAWILADELGLTDARAWSDLLKDYEKVDPLGALPRHRQLVLDQLVQADAYNYQQAARRLRKMRKLAEGSTLQREVDELVLELRETHRRRPRLQQEFDRAGLPR